MLRALAILNVSQISLDFSISNLILSKQFLFSSKLDDLQKLSGGKTHVADGLSQP